MSKLVEWADRVTEIYSDISSLVLKVQDLLAIPSEGTPTERLAAFRSVWNQLAIPEPAENSDSAKALRDRIAACLSPDNVQTVGEGFAKLGHALDHGITTAIEQGAEHAELIRTSDFGETSYVTTATAFLPIAFGLWDSLPEGHRLRELFQADDCLQVAGRPVIVLGLAPLNRAGVPSPRRYYPLDVARRFTAVRRQQQRLEETEKAAERAREEAYRAERLRHEQPLQERLRQLEAKLARLEGK